MDGDDRDDEDWDNRGDGDGNEMMMKNRGTAHCPNEYRGMLADCHSEGRETLPHCHNDDMGDFGCVSDRGNTAFVYL